MISKRILISGAAFAILRATFILLYKLGAKLILLFINDEGINSTKYLCDVTFVDGITAILKNLARIKPGIISAVENWEKLNGFVYLAFTPHVSTLKSINLNSTTDFLNLNTVGSLQVLVIAKNKKFFQGF